MTNLPAALYALAATIWLVLGVLNFNVIYWGLAVVFFVLAYKKRKPKEE
ncbi:MAG: hypothetical protein J6V34_05630 [Oscillospiraceae bacterium]|nr:hypothetical protein [Oscillospiraceae bacterium]